MAIALIVVDVQNDFCPGGALPVPKGDEVVSLINELVASELFDVILFTQDWHPKNHCSFVENGGTWPKHCIQNTYGAKLHEKLNLQEGHILVRKGANANEEAYSGFQGTGLEDTLKQAGINKVFVCGLATDYCVKATATDSAKLGHGTYVLIDACRGVNVKKGNIERAIEDMAEAGVKIISYPNTKGLLRAIKYEKGVN
jgi:nicotinamidase/pyrazinamidase